VCDDDVVACLRRPQPRAPGDRFAADPTVTGLDAPADDGEPLDG
jgi:hypothetical protein